MWGFWCRKLTENVVPLQGSKNATRLFCERACKRRGVHGKVHAHGNFAVLAEQVLYLRHVLQFVASRSGGLSRCAVIMMRRRPVSLEGQSRGPVANQGRPGLAGVRLGRNL